MPASLTIAVGDRYRANPVTVPLIDPRVMPRAPEGNGPTPLGIASRR
jgi:hypothetical protein